MAADAVGGDDRVAGADDLVGVGTSQGLVHDEMPTAIDGQAAEVSQVGCREGQRDDGIADPPQERER